MRLLRSSFLQQFEGSTLSLERLDASTQAELARAGIDLTTVAGVDQEISGETELRRLFRLIDTLDADGSTRSLITQSKGASTQAGRVVAALMAQRRTPRVSSYEPFVRRFVQGAIFADRLDTQRLADLGFDVDAMRELLDRDGRIAGENALRRLFLLVDQLDNDGSYWSVQTTEPIRDTDNAEDSLTAAGDALEMLTSCWLPFDQPFTEYADATRALLGLSGSVSLDVPHVVQMDRSGCFRAAFAMIRGFDSQIALAGPQQALILPRAENSHGELAGFASDFATGRNTIDRYLDAGRPALVGVSHSRRRINLDGMTDHFVVITGRSVDENDRVFYTYNDPATNGPHRVGRLYVDRDTNLLFRPPLSVRPGSFFARTYQVTQVRTYQDLLNS